MTKAFVGVKFIDGSHSVIPNKWIIYKKNKTYVHWPPSNQEIEAQKNEHPKETWKPYRASILVSSS